MNFDDWILSIEQQRADKEFLNKYQIRKLIREASDKFGDKDMPKMNKERMDKLYEEWFGDDEQCFLDQDDALARFRDMFEAMQNPINYDCDDCQKIGKVCYLNDNGLSHRVS